MNTNVSKLVRDYIPQILSLERAKQVQFRTLEDSEYAVMLNRKLLEEVDEYLEAENVEELIEELADIYEVLDAIVKDKTIDTDRIKETLASRYPLQLTHASLLRERAEIYVQTELLEDLIDVYEALEAIIRAKQFDPSLIEETKAKKRLERGGFEKHLLMESVIL